MPRNKGKGNKRNGQKKGTTDGIRDIVFKEEGQEYAQVTRMLGNGRLEAYCFDGKTRQCHIRGQMHRKVWINVSDVILVSLRDYEDGKADVIKKYNNDEIHQLKKCNEIPERLQTEEEKQKKTGDIGITFSAAAEEDDSDDYRDPSRLDISDDDDEDEYEDEEDYMPPPQNRNYTLDDL